MPFAQLKNVKLYYEEKGKGQTIIFIHGYTSNSWMWFNQMNYFSKKYRAIALDLKGHGASDKPKGNYLISEFATEVDEFVTQVLGNEKFVLVGHSMGGMIVLTYATKPQYAARLKALVPCGTTFKLGNPILSKIVGQLREGIIKNDESFREMMAKLGYNGKFVRMNRDLLKKTVEEALKCPDYVALSCLDSFVNKYNIEKDLPSISVPTLILTGDKDAMVSPEYAEQMRSLIPNSTVEIISPQVGHCLQVERPTEFNQTLEKFIKSL